MFKWIRLFYLAGLLTASLFTYANEDTKINPANPKWQQRSQESFKQYTQVVKRTQTVVSLLGAEIALNQGDYPTAISTYIANFKNTYDPDIAQRLSTILMAMHAYDSVDSLYQAWLQHGDTTLPVTQYLRFNRALAQKNTKEINELIEEVFEANDDTQRNQLFYVLITRDAGKDFEKSIAKKIYQITKKYQHLSAANITGLYFATQNHHDSHALFSLNQFLKNEPQLDTQEQSLLRISVQEYPSLWDSFFQQHPNDLSSSWQELKLSHLINQNRYDEASALIKHILDNNDTPSASLYFQAGLLSAQQNGVSNTSLTYLEKAHQHATGEQKSSTALFIALQHLNIFQTAQAKAWAEKIDAQHHAFEQNMLLTLIEQQQKNWKEALFYLEKAKQTAQRTHFVFSDGDITEFELAIQSELRTPEENIKQLTQHIEQLSQQPRDEANQKQLKQYLFQRAIVYSDELKQTQNAIADFRQMLALDPNDPVSQNALGFSLLDGNESEINEGFALIQKAYLQDQSSAITDSLGWAYYKKGQHKEAILHLKRAYALLPSPEIAAHLGEVYWQNGQKEQAKQIWREAWQKDSTHPVLKETLKRFQITF